MSTTKRDIITLTCETCKKDYKINRSAEIPEKATSMRVNWCPACEEQAEDYYKEWFIYNEPEPIFIDPNQLNLF